MNLKSNKAEHCRKDDLDLIVECLIFRQPQLTSLQQVIPMAGQECYFRGVTWEGIAPEEGQCGKWLSVAMQGKFVPHLVEI